jgi:hypothetical protein
VPASDNVELEVEERSVTDDALAMIAELPVYQAEAVTLRIVAGLDVDSVARIMQCNPGSVRVLCHRGLRRLERRLQPSQVDSHAPAPKYSQISCGAMASRAAASLQSVPDPRKGRALPPNAGGLPAPPASRRGPPGPPGPARPLHHDL